jgi:hypothetical protein
VPGIGQERERVREDAADDFGGHADQDDSESPREALPRARAGVTADPAVLMLVFVRMCHLLHATRPGL